MRVAVKKPTEPHRKNWFLNRKLKNIQTGTEPEPELKKINNMTNKLGSLKSNVTYTKEPIP